MLQPSCKQELLAHARRSVAAAAVEKRPPTPPGREVDAALDRPSAAFVTLHDRTGHVRGCVGTTAFTKPLGAVVGEMARAASQRDPRFSPVRPEEVEDLRIEISVLSPPSLVGSIDEVEIGHHGLLVEGHGRRGLLLPQVARERAWDRATFAQETCRKAGLPSAAYLDDDVSLYCFMAEVFMEPTRGLSK